VSVAAVWLEHVPLVEAAPGQHGSSSIKQFQTRGWKQDSGGVRVNAHAARHHKYIISSQHSPGVDGSGGQSSPVQSPPGPWLHSLGTPA